MPQPSVGSRTDVRPPAFDDVGDTPCVADSTFGGKPQQRRRVTPYVDRPRGPSLSTMINSQSIQIRRTALAVAAALTALGAAHAATAQASVSVEKTALGNYFVGAGAENNNLHVTNIGSEIYVSDENTTVSAGSGCVQVSTQAAKCADLPEGGLYLSMGGGTDRVDSTVTESFYVDGTQTDKLTAYAGPGPATLRGGAGDDVLHGGLGEDTIQGGKGNDVMDGSLSSDTLQGG